MATATPLTGTLMCKGLARGKARFSCAVAGIAAACGAVVFIFSLAATNAAQAPALARRACAPWSAWRIDGAVGFGRGRGGRGGPPPDATDAAARRRPGVAGAEAMGTDAMGAGAADLRLPLVGVQIDYRPGGHVLQGPPMTAVIAGGATNSPYAAAELRDGRWFDAEADDAEVVCTRDTLMRFGRGEPPPLGSAIRFVGQKGTMTAKVVGYLDAARLPPGWPGVFANAAAFDAMREEPHGAISFYRDNGEGREGGKNGAPLFTVESKAVIDSYKGDETRRMDYATPLMLVAAVLTALCLLVNSLLLSVEANRRVLATLRTVGMTRGSVVALVAAESILSTFCGWAIGGTGAVAALLPYVAADPVAFPTGAVVSWRTFAVTLFVAAGVSLLAVLFALRPALSVRPLDALDERPHRRRRGMAVAFACGFAAFVAVEVWGASLMRGFIPSPEWPDAIVSILPEGAPSGEVANLAGINGVRRISVLHPLQLNLHPEVPMASPGRPAFRNALFLGADWLPAFRFVEGTWEEADAAIRATNACVISLMMSRAWNLHRGDMLRVSTGRAGDGAVATLPIAGVADVNWHMVTSRGLVRGRNGAPGMTDGPVFVSVPTVAALDSRPGAMGRATHLWVEYEPGFLAEKGVFPAGREIETAIADALGLSPANLANASTVRLHARDEIADGTLAHGSDVIGQAARVPFVFLAILAIGFVAMLSADADAAKREFAILRAVGATRGQLSARLAMGALRTALGGILFGVPLGALVGWLFTLKTGSIWPGMPHYFAAPVPVILEGAVGAVVFALLVAVPTATVLVTRQIRAH